MGHPAARGGAAEFGLLAVAPAVDLAPHAVGVRKGLLPLPTIYSIPLAFVCGLLLWVVVAAGALLR